jgi:hypothetical protein
MNDLPETAVHGTTFAALQHILGVDPRTRGLRPGGLSAGQKRMHVHFARHKSDDWRQTAGMRHQHVEVEIFIDLRVWYENGHRAYLSSANVILIPETIPPEFISNVTYAHEDRQLPLFVAPKSPTPNVVLLPAYAAIGDVSAAITSCRACGRSWTRGTRFCMSLNCGRAMTAFGVHDEVMHFDRMDRDSVLWTRYGLIPEELDHHRQEVSGPNEDRIFAAWPTPAQAKANRTAPSRGARASGTAGLGVSRLTAPPLPTGARQRDQSGNYQNWSNQKRLDKIRGCKKHNDKFGNPFRGHVHRYAESERYRTEMEKHGCPKHMTFIEGRHWMEPEEPWTP